MAAVRIRTSALTALALLSGYVMQVIHLAGAPHEICPAHGELLERTEPVGIVTPVVSAGRSSRVQVLRGPGPSHHHDQCLTTLGEDEGTIADGPAALGAAAAAATPLPLATARLGSPRQRLFRLAPKTSPPA